VSIGMPVYNGEPYVRAALDALTAQTYTDFELVVGDNGSTDHTAEIVLEVASRDPRVRLLPSDENRGAAWNYNRVFHATSGRYFRWAAHDDLVAPTHLERLVEALDEASRGTVLSQSLTTFIDVDGNEIKPWDDEFDVSSERASERLRELVRHLVMCNVAFGLTRRSAMERTRLHGAYPSADRVFLAEMALLGKFTIVPERLFLRRLHPGMSRKANSSLSEVAEWFEPGSGREVRPEYVHLFTEHVRAIVHSPIGLGPRMNVLGVFLPTWLERYGRTMASEARRGIKARAWPRPG
jgi:glycosyltransferase involved in cell wall biosynthesis